MFKQILAIDIASRIDDFNERIKTFSKTSPLIVNTAVEHAKISHLDAIDAILVSIYQPLSEKILSLMPNLRYLGILGTSLKLIPVPYLKKREVHIAYVTDYCDDETAEWVMMQILQFFRKSPQPKSVCQKKLGVIGAGVIGKKLIDRAQAFAMEIFYNSSVENAELKKNLASFVSKEKIFRECDVVSFHTPAFLPWLSQPLLDQVKENSCLINTCMGRICIGDDLENFLKNRLDVTFIMDAIAALSYDTIHQNKTVFEPAFNTIDVQKKLMDKFFANIQSYFQSAPTR